MKRTAVQFGAGNIGRGFIAQLFHESGYEVVFIDVVPTVLEAMDRQRGYTIRIVGRGACDIPITDVRAIDGRDTEAAAEAIATCDVACTAVGAGALKFIAPNLARGLARRRERGGPPLNVLVCENLHNAGAVLRDLVAQNLDAGMRDDVTSHAGFVQAVVSRMVPLQEAGAEGDPLLIRVEQYKRLPVDAAAVVGSLPPIVCVEPVADFEAHESRKLFTHNCAHAVLGYLGWEAGIEFGYEALSDSRVRPTLDAVLAETGEALIRRYGFERAEHAAHVADLLDRFANVALGDTCFRLGRDPLRKLAPGDRLLGAARLCEEQGVEPSALVRVIASALRFSPPDDPSAQELRRRVREDGLTATLASVCGVGAGEPLSTGIAAAYEPAAPTTDVRR